MKRISILAVSISLTIALISVSGCERTGVPEKPQVSAVSPSPQSPPPTTIAPSAQQPRTPVGPPEASSAPAPCAPPVTPEVPVPVPAPAPVSAPDLAVKQKRADTIRVAVFESAQMKNDAPLGWILESKKGGPVLSLERGSRIYYLHMRSNDSSFGVKKSITVDIKEYPYLNWRWKVTRLPEGGDVRKSDKDDQAIQLYVAFIPTGFPEALNTPILGYVWDNEAPKGWAGRSAEIGGEKLRYVVVRDKSDRLGLWYTEKRNIYEDYKNLLKDVKCAEPAGITHGVEFYINSQNTKSTAESYIGDVYFSKR